MTSDTLISEDTVKKALESARCANDFQAVQSLTRVLSWMRSSTIRYDFLSEDHRQALYRYRNPNQ